jgi:hypothetical protein
VALDEAVADAAMVKVITTVDAEEDEPTLGCVASANSVASLATLCSATGSALTETSPAKRRWQTW